MKKPRSPARFLSSLALVIGAALALAGCETEDATYAVVDNDYPGVADGGDPAAQTVVYKVWWSSSMFTAPLPGSAESDSVRIVHGNEFAYALLAPNWDPASDTAPTSLLPVRTKARLSVGRGGTLHIRLSDATVTGNCGVAGSGPLTQEDADLITQQIFPGDFAGGFYDARACSFRVPVTTGKDAGKAP